MTNEKKFWVAITFISLVILGITLMSTPNEKQLFKEFSEQFPQKFELSLVQDLKLQNSLEDIEIEYEFKKDTNTSNRFVYDKNSKEYQCWIKLKISSYDISALRNTSEKLWATTLKDIYTLCSEYEKSGFYFLTDSGKSFNVYLDAFDEDSQLYIRSDISSVWSKYDPNTDIYASGGYEYRYMDNKLTCISEPQKPPKDSGSYQPTPNYSNKKCTICKKKATNEFQGSYYCEEDYKKAIIWAMENIISKEK